MYKMKSMKEKDIENIKLMVNVSRLYYEEGKTQEEIGRMLNISRVKVLRLLDRARKEGIVSVKIFDPLAPLESLARELESLFSLKKAIVVPCGHLPKPLLTRELGKWGALLTEEILQDGDIIGIGWGSTVAECVQNINPTYKRDLTVVPLGGGTGQIAPSFQVNELSKSVGNKFKAKWYSLDIPIFVENGETKEVLFKEPVVRDVVNLWDKLSVVLVGIGNISGLRAGHSPLIAIPEDIAETLKKELVLYNAVGDIAQNYFDINGNIMPISIRENIISINIEQIKKARDIIAVSGGDDKKEAILGALRLGKITHLVTDDSVGKYILEKENILAKDNSLNIAKFNLNI